MTFNAFFRIDYVGAADSGVGAIAFANGKIAGLDVAGVVYKGSYDVRDGRVIAKVEMSAPQGARLVTGAPLPVGASIPLEVEAAVERIDGHVIKIQSPSGPVDVRFTKVGDL